MFTCTYYQLYSDVAPVVGVLLAFWFLCGSEMFLFLCFCQEMVGIVVCV